MAMLNVIPWVYTKDGRAVEITEVSSGEACECTCPKCGEKVVVKISERLGRHFAHAGNSTKCSGRCERAVYLAAKRIIAERSMIMVHDTYFTLPRTSGRYPDVCVRSTPIKLPGGAWIGDRGNIDVKLGGHLLDVVLYRGTERMGVVISHAGRAIDDLRNALQGEDFPILEVALDDPWQLTNRGKILAFAMSGESRIFVANPATNAARVSAMVELSALQKTEELAQLEAAQDEVQRRAEVREAEWLAYLDVEEPERATFERAAAEERRLNKIREQEEQLLRDVRIEQHRCESAAEQARLEDEARERAERIARAPLLVPDNYHAWGVTEQVTFEIGLRTPVVTNIAGAGPFPWKLRIINAFALGVGGDSAGRTHQIESIFAYVDSLYFLSANHGGERAEKLVRDFMGEIAKAGFGFFTAEKDTFTSIQHVSAYCAYPEYIRFRALLAGTTLAVDAIPSSIRVIDPNFQLALFRIILDTDAEGGSLRVHWLRQWAAKDGGRGYDQNWLIRCFSSFARAVIGSDCGEILSPGWLSTSAKRLSAAA